MATAAGADSLWAKRDARSAYLFIDNRARRVGDLLTVVIAETTGIDNKDERQMSKSESGSATFNFTGSSSAGQLARDAKVSMETSGSANRAFDGKSLYNVGQSFQDRMTVVVIDVLPNGNLVIEGYRKRFVSGEERVICVTGQVRPIDISILNTVLSQSIANFNIRYLGRGPETRFTNQNYFGCFLNYVWPF